LPLITENHTNQAKNGLASEQTIHLVSSQFFSTSEKILLAFSIMLSYFYTRVGARKKNSDFSYKKFIPDLALTILEFKQVSDRDIQKCGAHIV
jgi:hypothetical protein